MNFAECCTNELEFRICTNCNNIQYKVYIPFEKNVNIYYQHLLTFVIFSLINVFINAYYYCFKRYCFSEEFKISARVVD